MQSLFVSAEFPLAMGFVYLLIAGFYELRTYRVPNMLTLAAIGLALLFTLIATVFAPERSGSILSAVVGMLLGGMLLVPFYSKGMLGAGCVKAQAACGAWIGAGFALGTCLKIVLISTVVAAVVAMICYGITYAKRKKNAQPNPYADSSVSVPNIMTLMHGQLPLSIGTMLGVIVASLV